MTESNKETDMHDSILTFHENGTASALHTDAIPLQSLGALKVSRASTIEFNEADQLWEVRIPDALTNTSAVFFTNASREVCLAWEHSYFNGKI
jgi:hypothetical protein